MANVVGNTTEIEVPEGVFLGDKPILVHHGNDSATRVLIFDRLPATGKIILPFSTTSRVAIDYEIPNQ